MGTKPGRMRFPPAEVVDAGGAVVAVAGVLDVGAGAGDVAGELVAAVDADSGAAAAGEDEAGVVGVVGEVDPERPAPPSNFAAKHCAISGTSVPAFGTREST